MRAITHAQKYAVSTLSDVAVETQISFRLLHMIYTASLFNENSYSAFAARRYLFDSDAVKSSDMLPVCGCLFI
jgi:hypothetical protein